MIKEFDSDFAHYNILCIAYYTLLTSDKRENFNYILLTLTTFY